MKKNYYLVKLIINYDTMYNYALCYSNHSILLFYPSFFAILIPYFFSIPFVILSISDEAVYISINLFFLMMTISRQLLIVMFNLQYLLTTITDQ